MYKSKLDPMFNQAPYHEDIWGSGGMDPCIPSLGQ